KVEKAMDLKSLFHPRSVALIGASTEQNKLSGRPFRFFREFGYAGNIYPVNPRYTETAGVPCFAKVSDLPGEVDLAVITLPRSRAPPGPRGSWRQRRQGGGHHQLGIRRSRRRRTWPARRIASYCSREPDCRLRPQLFRICVLSRESHCHF